MVRNIGYSVEVMASGSSEQLNPFQAGVGGILAQISPDARMTIAESAPISSRDFHIAPSIRSEWMPPHLPVDLAPCEACRIEFNDPASRRFQFWFISCTDCGPRYSVMSAAPFDRVNSSFAKFEPCHDCRAEFDDPENRRFHAQLISCHQCGPRLELRIHKQTQTPDSDLSPLCDEVNRGKIALIKSFGGYHYICRADSDEAVSRLRMIKRRPDKSFGLLFRNAAHISEHCHTTADDFKFLEQPSRPLLVLDQLCQPQSKLSRFIAPGLRSYAVMLPPNMLLEALAAHCPSPLVVTSANLKSEPITYNDQSAMQELAPLVDLTLTHNLEILNPIDDSVFASSSAGIFPLRLGRGFAPLVISAESSKLTGSHAISYGAFDKITVAIQHDQHIMVSPHFGDSLSSEVITRIRHYSARFSTPEKLEHIVFDAHPDAHSDSMVRSGNKLQQRKVFHHRAHAAAALLDRRQNSPCMIATMDGTGFGADHTSWGCDFWRFDGIKHFERLGQLRPIELIGGEMSISDISRIAFALVHRSTDHSCAAKISQLMGIASETADRYRAMLKNRTHIVRSHGMGRLFDGVAALLGCTRQPSYDGQAPLELEAMACEEEMGCYQFDLEASGPIVILDWSPLIRSICDDILKDVPARVISARFHHAVAKWTIEVCAKFGQRNLTLTGGVAQNRRILNLLQRSGQVNLSIMSILPPNDASISAGQIIADQFEWTDHANQGRS